MNKPKFNPNEAFEVGGEKPSFNPNEAFETYKGPDVSGLESLLRGTSQGMTLGNADEMEGAGKAFFDDMASLVVGESIGPKPKYNEEGVLLNANELQGTYKQHRDNARLAHKNAQDANPGLYTTGEIVGGIGTALVPGMNLAKGAKLNQVVKQSAAMGGATGLGYSNEEDTTGQVQDTLIGLGTGAIIPYGLSKAGNAALTQVKKGIDSLARASTKIQKRANYKEIIEAARELGLDVTPGMLDDSGFIERLEYTLANSSSFLGQRVKRAQDKITTGLQETAEEATKDATNLSPFQTGEEVKNQITSSFDEKLAPASMVFNEVAESTRNIPVNETGIGRIIENIKKNDLGVFGEEGKPAQYLKMLGRSKTVDDLKTVLTYLNSDIKDATGAERIVLGKIKDRISKAEGRYIDNAIDELEEMGADSIPYNLRQDLKDARKVWAETNNQAREFGKGIRVKAENVAQLLDSIDNIPSERIGEKLFNLKDKRTVLALAKDFPQEFQLLRQGKLRDIAEKSINNSIGGNGEVSTSKFLTQLRKLDPEAQQILFGDQLGKINSLRTIHQSLPKNFNPSGTASQGDWINWVTSNAKAIPTWAAYKTLSSDLAQDVGRGAINLSKNKALRQGSNGGRLVSPRLAQIANTEAMALPKVSQSVMAADNNEKKLRGKEKWAAEGEEKIKKHDPSISEKIDFEKIKQSKKGQALLMRASDFKPNSKAFAKVLRDIKKLKAGVDNG